MQLHVYNAITCQKDSNIKHLMASHKLFHSCFVADRGCREQTLFDTVKSRDLKSESGQITVLSQYWVMVYGICMVVDECLHGNVLDPYGPHFKKE